MKYYKPLINHPLFFVVIITSAQNNDIETTVGLRDYTAWSTCLNNLDSFSETVRNKNAYRYLMGAKPNEVKITMARIKKNIC